MPFLSDGQQSHKEQFALWIDSFFDEINLPATTPVYICHDGKTFTVADYIRVMKDSSDIQISCRQRLLYERDNGGRMAVLEMLTATAPVVFPELQKELSLCQFGY